MINDTATSMAVPASGLALEGTTALNEPDGCCHVTDPRENSGASHRSIAPHPLMQKGGAPRPGAPSATR
jgi:hypothetical protein